MQMRRHWWVALRFRWYSLLTNANRFRALYQGGTGSRRQGWKSHYISLRQGKILIFRSYPVICGHLFPLDSANWTAFAKVRQYSALRGLLLGLAARILIFRSFADIFTKFGSPLPTDRRVGLVACEGRISRISCRDNRRPEIRGNLISLPFPAKSCQFRPFRGIYRVGCERSIPP